MPSIEIHHASRGRALPVLAGLTVAAAATLPYVPTLSGYFGGDDFGFIQAFADRPLGDFASLFWQSWAAGLWGQGSWGQVGDEIRPVAALLYRFGSMLGPTPAPQHGINIALHVLTSVIVLAGARAIAPTTWSAATFAAVLFALMPAHAETVAWITGRSDALLGLCYAASVLLFATWRRWGHRASYAGALVAYVAALYSKQPAITLPLLLVAWDLVCGRARLRDLGTWVWARPHLPFWAATAAMLALRVSLFGQGLREDLLTLPRLYEHALDQGNYLQTLVFGSVLLNKRRIVAAALVAIGLALFVAARRSDVLRTSSQRQRWAPLVFFGPIWWLVTTTPFVVAEYTSARFLYLPAIGAAIAAGVLADRVLAHPGTRRRVMAGAGVVWIGLFIWQLTTAVHAWTDTASAAADVAATVAREASAAAPGTLLVLDVPERGGTARFPTWFWSWTVPYALRPPFMASDLTARVPILVPRSAYHDRENWRSFVRQIADEWQGSPAARSIVFLRWDGVTTRVRRSAERDDPDLARRVAALSVAPSDAELDARWQALIAAAP